MGGFQRAKSGCQHPSRSCAARTGECRSTHGVCTTHARAVEGDVRAERTHRSYRLTPPRKRVSSCPPLACPRRRLPRPVACAAHLQQESLHLRSARCRRRPPRVGLRSAAQPRPRHSPPRAGTGTSWCRGRRRRRSRPSASAVAARAHRSTRPPPPHIRPSRRRVAAPRRPRRRLAPPRCAAAAGSPRPPATAAAARAAAGSRVRSATRRARRRASSSPTRAPPCRA